MAAPRKFNPELGEAIIKLVGLVPIKVAAESVKITRMTLHNWRKRGKKAIEEGNLDDPMAKWELGMQAALSQVQIDLTKIIQYHAGGPGTDKGDKGDWKAAAWMLERRFPQEYSQYKQLEHKVSSGVEEVREGLSALLQEGAQAVGESEPVLRKTVPARGGDE